jgi:hypothetical protein
MLSTESSRHIASKFDIGRTTVNKHRNECMKAPGQKSAWEDLQSIDWSGSTGVWNTGSIETVLDNISHDAILEKFGHDPKKVAIKGVLRESHKEYWSTDLEKMLWKHSYSFSVERRVEGVTDDIDVVALLNSLPKTTGGSKPSKGIPSTFVLDWADWQMGKKEGGGTEALIERLESAFASAIVRVEELRSTGRKLEELVIVGGGDMIEGCVIYPQQAFGIDLNRREQIRNTVAAILRGLTLLAPLFETVRVVVVPGNHGEHRITGNRTEIGDNDDLLVFEMAQVGCANDPRFKHVSFV